MKLSDEMVFLILSSLDMTRPWVKIFFVQNNKKVYRHMQNIWKYQKPKAAPNRHQKGIWLGIDRKTLQSPKGSNFSKLCSIYNDIYTGKQDHCTPNCQSYKTVTAPKKHEKNRYVFSCFLPRPHTASIKTAHAQHLPLQRLVTQPPQSPPRDRRTAGAPYQW